MELKAILGIMAVGLMLAVGFAGCIGGNTEEDAFEYETGTATWDGIFKSISMSSEEGHTLVARDSSPFYALIGTPASCRYENGVQKIRPLLVENETSSRIRELQEGDMSSLFPMGWNTIGELGLENDSIYIAERYWNYAESAIILKADQQGYNLGVVIAPAACYLNIPIFVIYNMTEEIAQALNKLRVENTIVCGNVEGYKNVLRINNADEALEFATAAAQKNGGVKYVAMANPLDTTHYAVLESNKTVFTGVVTKNIEGSGVPAAASPDSDANPKHEVKIPDGWNKAIVKFTLKYDLPPEWDLIGDIVQGYLYSVDADGKETMEIYFRSPGGRREGNQVVADYIVPAFNKGGTIQRWSMQAWIQSPTAIVNGITYYLDVDVQKVDTMTYPLMPGLSSMAPYLAACRNGVVIAKPDFALQNPTYIGCIDCGEPAYDENAVELADLKAAAIHHELNKYLAKIAGMQYSEADPASWTELANYYYDKNFPVAIVADTNMVPMYYFGSASPSEGNGQATDVIYQDIDVDPESCPSGMNDNRLELCLGRVTGWDAQDVSTLMARSVFYNEIIDKVSTDLGAARAWKDTSYTFIGGAIPIEGMITNEINLDIVLAQNGGFVPISTVNAPGGSDVAGATLQQSSNYIWGGAHGFYCWYAITLAGAGLGLPVPTEVQDQDSVFDCVRVREMKFGPSVHFMVSCVTGRIDGLLPQNCLSQAYLHAGEVCYIGATRSTYGPIYPTNLIVAQAGSNTGGTIAINFFTGLCADDKPLGLAFRDAKNDYFAGEPDEIIYGHFVMYGDPALNTYEPNNA